MEGTKLEMILEDDKLCRVKLVITPYMNSSITCHL
ncbi:hypothetical protein SLEP1_g17062 [Rubroshorea leprosula]|uniref:Uncharacterized protein n=1 Tax=Rubroshorea leprosula TaxID=152421 RepID=A0AAV5IYV5_9ROSI|nr:hypothetical protein SLEP1_g17062 [Rubroshorea leprosula]